MKRDTIKTVAGLIIIVGIVVATFLYGNSQRQAQLAHDQEVKKQQEAKAQQQANSVSPSTSPAAGSSATKTPTPSKSPATVATGGTGTQGGTVAGASTVPVTGGTGAALPDTGPESAGMVGLSAIGVMLLAVRRSRKAMLAAARAQR